MKKTENAEEKRNPLTARRSSRFHYSDEGFTELKNSKIETPLDACRVLEFYVEDMITSRFPTYRIMHREELYQAGMIGILQAFPKYDQSKAKPTTFFKPYILHEMVKYVSEEIMGTTIYYGMAETKINDFERSHEGKSFTIKDIMLNTNLAYKTIAAVSANKAARACARYESMVIAEPSFEDDIIEAIDSMRNKKLVEEAFVETEDLTDLESSLITMYFGLNEMFPVPIKVLAKQFGLSSAHVNYAIKKGLKKLHPAISKKFGLYEQKKALRRGAAR